MAVSNKKKKQYTNDFAQWQNQNSGQLLAPLLAAAGKQAEKETPKVPYADITPKLTKVESTTSNSGGSALPSYSAMDISRGLNKAAKGLNYSIYGGINQAEYGAKSGVNLAQQLVNAALGNEANANMYANRNKRLAQEYLQEQQELGERYGTPETGAGQFASKALSGAVAMAPLLPLYAIPGVGQALGTGAIALTAGGMGQGNALMEGASVEDSLKYGALAGGIEAGTERLFGGIPLQKGLINVGGNVAAKVGKESLKPVIAKGVDILGEGVEEGIVEALDPFAQRATYNPDAENASAKDIAYAAALGMATAGIMNGAAQVPKVAKNLPNAEKVMQNDKNRAFEALHGQKMGQNQGIGAQTAQNHPEKAQAGRMTENIQRQQNGAQNQSSKAVFEQNDGKNVQNRNTNDITPKLEDARPKITLEMSERTFENVGAKNVKAYQQENPTVKPFQQEVAANLLSDLQMGQKGGREVGFDPMTRNVTVVNKIDRMQSEPINRMLDDGMAYSEIEDGLQRIVEDHGKENTANAKRAELYVHDAVKNGYNSVTGERVNPNRAFAYRGKSQAELLKIMEQLDNSFTGNAEQDAAVISEMETVQSILDGMKNDITPKLERVVQPEPTVAKNATTATTEESSTVESEPDSINNYAVFARERLKPEVQAFIEKVSKKLNADVIVMNGLPKGANGMFADGKVYLNGNNINGNESVRTVIAHEVYHSMKNTDEFRNLQDVAMEFYRTLNPRLTNDDWVQMKIEEYAEHDVPLSVDGAYDELTADFMEVALFDAKVAERIWTEHPTLAQRIKWFIDDLLFEFRNRKLSDLEYKQAALLYNAQQMYAEGLQSMKYRGQDSGNTRFMFAGENSRTADLEALARAKQMESDGADMESIRQATGWFKSVVTGNKWVYEISDKGVKFSRNTPRDASEIEAMRIKEEMGKALSEGDFERFAELDKQLKEMPVNNAKRENVLGDYLYHPELYAAYPQLRDMPFVFDETIDADGQYDPTFKEIYINTDMGVLYPGGMPNNARLDNVTNTMLHEIQHAIQHIEDIPNGASPEYWKRVLNDYYSTNSNMRNNLDLYLKDIGYPEFQQKQVQRVRNGEIDMDQYWKENEAFKNNSKHGKTIASLEKGIKEHEKNRSAYLTEYSPEAKRLAKEKNDIFRKFPYELQNLIRLQKSAAKEGNFDASSAYYDQIEEFLGKNPKPDDLYRNTAGEIMARDTKKRRNLDNEQRIKKQPEMGDKYTVYANSGNSYSVGSDTSIERFAEQVDAVLNDENFESSHLSLGRTPDALLSVGMPDLPVYMTAKHVYTMANSSGKYTGANYHGMGSDLVKQLPEAIANPLLIAESNTRNDSVVLLTKLSDKNGRPVIAAIKFNGKAYDEGVEVEANILSSAYGKDYIAKLFTVHNLLYVNKKESSLLNNIPGLQLPNNIATMNFNNNVARFRKKVKNSMNNQTISSNDIRYSLPSDKSYMDAVNNGDMETAQRMVDEAAKAAGYSERLYHQTGAVFSEFNTENQKAGKYDYIMPTGIFLKPDDSDIGLRGKLQMGLYANIKNPLKFRDRIEMQYYWFEHLPNYENLFRQIEENDVEYKKLIDIAMDKMRQSRTDFFDGKITEEDRTRIREEAHAESDRLFAEWREANNKLSLQMKSMIDNYMNSLDFDSVIVENDEGAFGRSTKAYIVFNPNQLKSADVATYDNEGNIVPLSQRFDAGNTDIRYSLSSNITTGAQLKEAKATVRDKINELSKKLEAYSVPLETLGDERIGRRTALKDARHAMSDEAAYEKYHQRAVEGGYADLFEQYIEKKREEVELNGIGRHGTDSQDRLLTQEQYEFLEDSIVTDSEGRPLVVYHGSPNKFYEFDWGRVGRNGTQEGRGFYFTDDESVAEQYVNSTNGGVREFYLRMKKPLNGLKVTMKKSEVKKLLKEADKFMMQHFDDEWFLSNFGDTDTYGKEKVINEAAENLFRWNNSDVDILYDIMNTAGISRNEDTAEFLKFITDKFGYDGTYTEWKNWENDDVSRIYVTFDSSNAKLTSNQKPTNNPDIRYSMGNSRYQDMIDQYGSIEPGENPTGNNRDVKVPKQTSDFDKTRKFTRTAMESEQVDDVTTGMIADDLTADMQSGRFVYEPTSNQKQVDRANSLINQTGWEQQAENFRAKYRSGESMSADDIALGERLIQEAQKAGDYQMAVQLIADVAAIGTEAGRSVQALKILKRLTPEGQLMALKRIEQRINSSLAAQQKPPVALPEAIAEEMLQARGSEKQAEIWDKAIKELANQVPATFADKVNAWRYLAMLSNPKTHIRNMVGNATMRTVMGVKNVVQTGIETTLSPFGIERTAAIKVPKEYRDFAKWDFENNARKMLEAGGGRYNDEIGLVSQNKQIFKNPVLESARKKNTELLEAEDMLFKKAAYIDAMARYMKANGLSPSVLQNKSAGNNATYEKAQNYAVEQARKATFQEASKLAQKLSEIENMSATGKVMIGALVPFKKTPINILKRGMEYSPVGIINGVKKAVFDVKKGDATPAEVIDAMSAGLTGTGIMMVGYFLASMGLLSAGADDDDQRKARYDSQMGNQNYALVLPDGSTYTIDWLAPSVMPMMVGAELHKQLNGEQADSNNATGFTKALEALTRVGNPLLEMSMMQGLTEAVQSYNTGTGQFLSDFAISAGTGYAGQFIPAPVGALARTMDDTMRSSYAPKDSPLMKEGESFLRQQANKLPIASQQMQPSIDLWGNERKREGDTIAERAFHNFINPGTYSSNKRTALDNKLDKLYEATGDSNVLPKTAASYIDVGDKTIYMTALEYAQFSTTKGQKSKEYVTDFINSSAYRTLDDTTKADIVNNLYNLAKYQAEKQILSGRRMSAPNENYEKVLKSGVAPGKYYATKEALSNFTGDGSKDKKIAYLQNMKNSGEITDRQFWYLRRACIGTFNNAEKAACPYADIKNM